MFVDFNAMFKSFLKIYYRFDCLLIHVCYQFLLPACSFLPFFGSRRTYQNIFIYPISGQRSHFIPSKNKENHRFSGVFRGYKMGKLARNGLMIDLAQVSVIPKRPFRKLSLTRSQQEKQQPLHLQGCRYDFKLKLTHLNSFGWRRHF